MTDSGRLSPEDLAGHTVILVVPHGPLEAWMPERVWQIARMATAGQRRVALIDLSLREPVLHRHLSNPPKTGIADALLRDVPISEAAQRQDSSTLHFLAAGNQAGQPGEVWGHARWPRLASGFASERALLIAFVPPQALPVLNLPVDALILLEHDDHLPASQPSPGLQRLLDGAIPVLASLGPHATVGSPPPATEPAGTRPPFRARRARALPAWVPLASAAALVTLLALFILTRGGTGNETAGPPLGAAQEDTLFYTLQIAAFTALERALDRAADLDQDGFTTTVTPVRRGTMETWYRVQIGMLGHSTAADSTLQALWESHRVERAQGTILRTPYAFDLGQHDTRDEAFSAARGLRESGIPAYVLVAPNGARVLFGAFEERDQATVAESLLVSAGLESHLVSRLGIAR